MSLKEKLRIRDETGDFYFKYPGSPIIDEQGFIFAEDQEQLLMFSPTGTFIRNFFKKGQGPGEMTNVNTVIPGKDHIIICNENPWKLLRFDRQGKMLKEERLADIYGYTTFVSLYNGRYFFLNERFHDTKNKAVYVDLEVQILSLSVGDKKPKSENIRFPKKYFVMNTNWIMNVHFVQVGKANNYTVFVANDGNYDIKRMDFKKMSISPFIKKEYKKVEIKKEWKKILKPSRFPHYGVSGKEYKTFERKALDDVQRIFINRDKIWVLTSTFAEETRLVRTDVYDLNGKSKGSFRLKMPEGIYLFQMSYADMTIHKEKLYIFETSEEGEIDLACYNLINIPGWAR